MTDAEVICTFMEPKPKFAGDPGTISVLGWWWASGKKWTPSELSLDELHKVEERLTDEHWNSYCATFAVDNLPQPLDNLSYEETVRWDKAHLHATAPQKIKALAEVLRNTR